MSRIGNKPIEIPAGVKVEENGGTVKVTGKLGTMQMQCEPGLTVTVAEGGKLVHVVDSKPEDRHSHAMHGTTRALLANMVTGVSQGFRRGIEIYGTGYSVKEQGGKINLTVGYAHTVELPVPQGVKVDIEVAATRGNEVPAKFSVSGMDKCDVMQFAANIRRVKPPEPYKGKGIRYADEQIRRKAGKAFASGGA
jgi:large subunit ribosomal protein L6